MPIFASDSRFLLNTILTSATRRRRSRQPCRYHCSRGKTYRRRGPCHCRYGRCSRPFEARRAMHYPPGSCRWPRCLGLPACRGCYSSKSPCLETAKLQRYHEPSHVGRLPSGTRCLAACVLGHQSALGSSLHLRARVQSDPKLGAGRSWASACPTRSEATSKVLVVCRMNSSGPLQHVPANGWPVLCLPPHRQRSRNHASLR